MARTAISIWTQVERGITGVTTIFHAGCGVTDAAATGFIAATARAVYRLEKMGYPEVGLTRNIGYASIFPFNVVAASHNEACAHTSLSSRFRTITP